MQDGDPMKTIVEQALEKLLKHEQIAAGQPFRLQKHAFEGEGLQADVQEGDWSLIRQRAYAGRGG